MSPCGPREFTMMLIDRPTTTMTRMFDNFSQPDDDDGGDDNGGADDDLLSPKSNMQDVSNVEK